MCRRMPRIRRGLHPLPMPTECCSEAATPLSIPFCSSLRYSRPSAGALHPKQWINTWRLVLRSNRNSTAPHQQILVDLQVAVMVGQEGSAVQWREALQRGQPTELCCRGGVAAGVVPLAP